MPCEFCPHCKEKAEIEAALAVQMSQSFDENSKMAASAPPPHNVPTLNAYQQPIAFDVCNNFRSAKLHFIDGISGTGKTYLLYAMYCLFKNMKINVEIISLSPFPTPPKSILKFLSLMDNEIEQIEVILIDNVNQITEQLMKSLCEKLKRVMGNDLPFGGKTLVLAGDFGQLLPFTNNAAKVKESLKHLTTNVVAPFKYHLLPTGTDEFQQFLSMVRKTPQFKIPDSLNAPNKEELINFCFGSVQDQPPYPKSIILTARKADAEVINRRVLEKMKGRVQIFEAHFNGRVIRSDLDLHQLRLKKNCILVLEEPCEGHPKGTRLIYEESTRSHLCCRTIDTNLQVDIERINRYIAPSTTSPQKRKGFKTDQQCVKQFPVSVNFGSTIHAAQGRKFEKVGIYKASQVFEHGMLYTAISRAESLDGIRINSEQQFIQNKIEMSLL